MSSASEPWIEIEVPADRAGLSRLLDFVAAGTARLGLAPELGQRLAVALDELVGNLLLHDGTVTAQDRLSIALRRTAAGAELRLRDPGTAFDPEAWPPEAPRPVGGLGLRLARAMVDELAYQRRSDGNEVTLIAHARVPT